MEQEAPPADMLCSVCREAQFSWKCLDCQGGCFYCTPCLRQLHQQSPFHRIKSWDGSCFERAWLYQTGIEIHLGHNGAPCPATICEDPEPPEDTGTPWISTPLADDELEGTQPDPGIPLGASRKSGFPRYQKRNYKLIVDQTGVHPLKVNLCYCLGAEAQDLQYMSSGLFPASFEQVETAFTFRVLDDLRMENLECKTPVLNYWHCLRRITAPLDPESVPVSI